MPEVFTPSLSLEEYGESGFSGIDSFFASLFYEKWIGFTYFTTIHLLVYMIIKAVKVIIKKVKKD